MVIRSAIVASLGGLLFGFDTAVISGAEEKLTKLYALSSMGEGMIVAIATIGTICGAIVAGKLADRFGRKPILFWIGILFGVGALATALAPVPTLVTAADGTVSASSAFPITFFMIFRFLGGVGVGLSSVVAPIYTAEIAPARVRGRLVGLVQFNIVFGILLAYASNAVIREIAHEETAWRWMLGVMAVPAVFFLIFLATVPRDAALAARPRARGTRREDFRAPDHHAGRKQRADRRDEGADRRGRRGRQGRLLHAPLPQGHPHGLLHRDVQPALGH